MNSKSESLSYETRSIACLTRLANERPSQGSELLAQEVKSSRRGYRQDWDSIWLTTLLESLVPDNGWRPSLWPRLSLRIPITILVVAKSVDNPCGGGLYRNGYSQSRQNHSDSKVLLTKASNKAIVRNSSWELMNCDIEMKSQRVTPRGYGLNFGCFRLQRERFVTWSR